MKQFLVLWIKIRTSMYDNSHHNVSLVFFILNSNISIAISVLVVFSPRFGARLFYFSIKWNSIEIFFFQKCFEASAAYSAQVFDLKIRSYITKLTSVKKNNKNYNGNFSALHAVTTTNTSFSTSHLLLYLINCTFVIRINPASKKENARDLYNCTRNYVKWWAFQTFAQRFKFASKNFSF